jgi:Tol biopolymer transport system component
MTRSQPIAVLGLGALAALIGMSAAARASTLPGRDGPIAASASTRIGIVTPRHTLRSVLTTSLDVVISDLSFSPDGRRIAYDEFNGAPGRSLAILNLDTHEVEPIGAHGLHVGAPAFLSNGKIVFAGSHAQGRHPGTFEIDANGAHLHRLFGSQELAASADGRWFVRTDARGNFHTLFLLDRRGRPLRNLTRDAAYRYIQATFSPNGRWIAYAREIERPGQARHRSDIFVVRRDGTHRRRLTHGGNASDPVFSPSGKWIAYTHFNSGPGGNLAMLCVRHPGRHMAVTRVRGARFQSPAWASR